MKRPNHPLIWTAVIAVAAGFLFASASPTRADLNENEFNSGNGETYNDEFSPSGYWDPDWRDWEDISDSVTVKADIPNRAIDDSFGQGSKEDDPHVSVTLGSIPPNKSDLTNFYVASEKRMTSETTYAHTFLYLAWTRTNALGSANMDFELNQVPADLSATGAMTINRTAKDVLFTYDFEKGGKVPSIAALFWIDSGTASRCYAGNRLPCWGDRMVLLETSTVVETDLAEGSINKAAFYDNVVAGFPEGDERGVYRPALTFGEMAIDLSEVMPDAFGENPKQCSGLSSMFLKSRSSSSFTAELKDFVAPKAVSFSNCGAVKIVKTGKSAAAQGEIPLAGAQFRLSHKTSGAVIDTKTTDVTGELCFNNVLLNTDNVFTVSEIAAPSGYADSVSKDVTIVAGTTCDGTGDDPILLSFVDEPLTTITVSTTSLAGAGVTASTVQCVKTSDTGTVTNETEPSDTPHTTIALKPGTYDCTVVIDP